MEHSVLSCTLIDRDLNMESEPALLGGLNSKKTIFPSFAQFHVRRKRR